MQVLSRGGHKKLEDEAGAASDAPSSPAKSTGSMSGMSDAMADKSSCDDMGASASDADYSEPERRVEKVVLGRKHKSGTRRRRLSSAKLLGHRKAAQQNFLDDSDDGTGHWKSQPASSGRKSLARHAKLDGSGSDEEAGAAAEGKSPAAQETHSPRSAGPNRKQDDKSIKRHDSTRKLEAGSDPDADLAASDSDAGPRRRASRQKRAAAVLRENDGMAASPGRPGHSSLDIEPSVQFSDVVAAETNGADSEGRAAEAVPVHDEPVDLFDSDSDAQGPGSDPPSSDDEADAEAAEGDTADAEAAVAAAGDAQAAISARERGFPNGPNGGVEINANPPWKMSSPIETGLAAAIHTTAEPLGTCKSSGFKAARKAGDRVQPAKQRMICLDHSSEEAKSPASTVKHSDGDADAAGGDQDMADAETMSRQPSADLAMPDHQEGDSSSHAASPETGASAEESPDSQQDTSDVPQESSGPGSVESETSCDDVQPAGADAEMESETAEDHANLESCSDGGAQTGAATPMKQVSRKGVLSSSKTPAAAHGDESMSADDEMAAAGLQTPAAAAEAAQSDHGTSVAGAAGPTAEGEGPMAGESAANADQGNPAAADLIRPEAAIAAENEKPAADEEAAAPDHKIPAGDEAAAAAEASPPPRLTSKKFAKRSMLGRLSLDVGKLWPFNRGSKAPAASSTKEDAPSGDHTNKAATPGPSGAVKPMDVDQSDPGQDANEAGAQSRPFTPRAASADDDEMPFSALIKKGATPQTGGRFSATPKGLEKRHGVSSSKRKGQRSSARLAGRTSKCMADSPNKGHLIQSNDEVSAGWKVSPHSPTMIMNIMQVMIEASILRPMESAGC